MSSYQHKSGAQKRREKNIHDRETRQGARTLFDVWKREETLGGGEMVVEDPGALSYQSEQPLSKETAEDQRAVAENKQVELQEKILQPPAQQEVVTMPENVGFDISVSTFSHAKGNRRDG